MTVKQILSAILLVVFPLILRASDYYVATTDLNVRSGAGQGYTVYYTLRKGDEVEYLLKVNNWYKINYSGKIGYAHSEYLKYNRTTLPETRVQIPQQPTKSLLIGVLIFLAISIFFILFRKTQRNSISASAKTPDRGT